MKELSKQKSLVNTNMLFFVCTIAINYEYYALLHFLFFSLNYEE